MIKEILSSTPSVIYRCNNRNNEDELMTSILISNTVGVNSRVWLLIKNNKDTAVNAGAILYGTLLDPNELMDLPNKRLKYGDFVEAYSDNENAISFYADVENIKE
ncbi:MAG: hypothetical protein H7321_09290 [Bacteroidia bacterium]|nr:hypothetical protein [Bacteroidia bacterium]